MQNVTIMQVTPELARTWLAKNTRNRNIVQPAVDALVQDMRNGNWHLTNQGIGFYEDGSLADGQHRLHAIIKSGVTVTMQVTHGLKREAIMGIDSHRARNAADIINLIGETAQVKSFDVAVLKLAFDTGSQKVSNETMLSMCHAALNDCHYIQNLIGNSRFAKSVVVAALLMALKAGVSRDDIEEFTSVLVSGAIKNNRDKCVIVIRDKVLAGELTKGGSSARAASVKKIQNIIFRFTNGECAKRVMRVDYYTYPPLRL